MTQPPSPLTMLLSRHTKRRAFITMIGGAAAAWPLAARAQQAAMPVIGYLNPYSADGQSERLRGFRQGLAETGYVDGVSVTIEYRWAENQFNRLPALAAELARRQVAVIAATGSLLSAMAAKAATTTIPVVFLVAEDPVRVGLVTSLAQPGGNLTGINFLSAELVGKRLGLLRELVPRIARVAVLVNQTNAINSETTLRDAQAAARALGLVLNASSSREINAAFTSLAHERPDALFVGGEGFFNNRRSQLVNLASRYALPATYAERVFPEIGGLMSYGPDIIDAYRQIGGYAGAVLRGAKAADLPVMQATKFELVINAETARMLGIEVPPTLLARADEVIE
jgi:putative tryptophan/tyrosine transport system substrate-binding protein